MRSWLLIHSRTRFFGICKRWQNQRSAYLRNSRRSIQRLEWRQIAAFRNVLVHDYLGIDLDRIWQTTQKEVQQLKGSVETALKGGNPSEQDEEDSAAEQAADV